MAGKEVIKIPVSSLAGVCGMNPYVKEDEILNELWRRNHNLPVANGVKKVLYKKSPQDLDKIFEEVVKEKPSENMTRSEKMSAIDKKARQDLKDIESESKNTSEVQKGVKRSFEKIDKELASSVEGISRMSAGVAKESEILDDYEMGHNIKITKRNDAFLKIDLEFEDYIVRLNGRVDGMTTDPESGEEKVVEVKNRRSRLFRKVPQYEMVQCVTYCKMLNLKACVHIEKFNKLERATEIKYDDALWEKILESLRHFCDMYGIYDAEMKEAGV